MQSLQQDLVSILEYFCRNVIRSGSPAVLCDNGWGCVHVVVTWGLIHYSYQYLICGVGPCVQNITEMLLPRPKDSSFVSDQVQVNSTLQRHSSGMCGTTHVFQSSIEVFGLMTVVIPLDFICLGIPPLILHVSKLRLDVMADSGMLELCLQDMDYKNLTMHLMLSEYLFHVQIILDYNILLYQRWQEPFDRACHTKSPTHCLHYHQQSSQQGQEKLMLLQNCTCVVSSGNHITLSSLIGLDEGL